MPDATTPPTEILVESGVSYPGWRSFVNLRFGDQRAQLTPESAREHALSILAAADAAESDAFIIDFLQKRVGLTDPEKLAAVLSDFRAFRGHSA